jgi:hypothetical protein
LVAVVLAISALLDSDSRSDLPRRAQRLASDPDNGHHRHTRRVWFHEDKRSGFNDRFCSRTAPKAVFVGDSFTFGVTPFAEAFSIAWRT